MRLADVDRAVVEDDHNGLDHQPGLGPQTRSSVSRKAMKSAMRLVRRVVTMSLRLGPVKAPLMATFCDDQVQEGEGQPRAHMHVALISPGVLG